jgi:hypothetical protein
MTKKILTFGILAIVLAGVFVPSVVFGAETPNPVTGAIITGAAEMVNSTMGVANAGI